MRIPLENTERRKRRDPEIKVWDRVVRISHWLLAFAFATLYLEYRKFPLHPYAGYLVLIVVLARIVWGFVGPGAARFSSFWFGPRQMFSYFRSAIKGHAEYHFSHNPLGAAMVYALLAMIIADTLLGLLAYSASQQLGPFGALVPDAWEENLIIVHSWMGHLTALLVVGHLLGVIWAARLHRENYALSMLTGIRRIPRTVAIPDGAMRLVRRLNNPSRWQMLLSLIRYRRPVLGSLILMGVIIGLFMLPLIELLVRLNKLLPAY